jgi:transcriptional regulator with XRE-family HTH domain
MSRSFNRHMDSAATNSIRAAREALGMTREELAFKAGISFGTLERIERGQNTPRRATLAVLAEALGIPVEELKEAA